MQTATAYHPSSLYPEPPPRNAGVPDTSIAGGATEAKNTTSPQTPLQDRSTAPQAEQSTASISEGEAQKPQQVANPTKPLRPRRYNFGPRKATIKLSPSAVAHLRELLELPEPKLIRIGTKAKGCSGLAYHLEYVDKPSPLDEQVEQDGVKVLIDNKALLNIIGSEMDWLEDKLNERFIFRNPNISESSFDSIHEQALTSQKLSSADAESHLAYHDTLTSFCHTIEASGALHNGRYIQSPICHIILTLNIRAMILAFLRLLTTYFYIFPGS
jgi:iron-sulfur cluster assembly accessory protein